MVEELLEAKGKQLESSPGFVKAQDCRRCVGKSLAMQTNEA